MQYLGTIDKAKDIINKDFVEKLLGDYQPLINESSKLPYSLISGVPTSLPSSDVYSWAKSATKPTYTWSEITSKPTWIGSSKPSYSYSEITGAISTTELQNYLTSNSYLNVTSGDNRYLQLSGGTITGSLEIKCGADNKIVINNTDGEGYSRIVFQENGSYIGQLLSTKDGNIHWGESKIWHSGNDGSGSGLDADTLDGYHVTHFMSYIKGSGYVQANLLNSELWNVAGGDGYIEYYDNGTWFNSRWGKVTAHYGFEGSLSGNASSATKLQTARTIWGQSFDGSGNINGDFYLNSGRIGTYGNIVSANTISIVNWKGKDGTSLGYVGYYADHMIICNTRGGTTEHSIMELYDNGRVVINGDNGGNVGIGTTSPQQKLHVEGHVWANGDITAKTKIHAFGNLIANDNVGIGTESPSAKLHIVNNTNTSTGLRLDGGWSGYGFLYNGINIFLNGEQYGGIGVNTVSSAYGSTAAAGTYITNAKSGEYMNFYNEGGTFLKSSLLVNGGITMYSDQRKKTILNHVELSLKQIAEAPLIEHYYNSDEKKTTHVGSIAQYWASMNDWFCKLDSEGYYTMEIQNAALASAISIARELERYETTTDKAINKLKKRICELEEEVERLKSA